MNLSSGDHLWVKVHLILWEGLESTGDIWMSWSAGTDLDDLECTNIFGLCVVTSTFYVHFGGGGHQRKLQYRSVVTTAREGDGAKEGITASGVV